MWSRSGTTSSQPSSHLNQERDGDDNDMWVMAAENLVAAFTGGGWCFLRIWEEALAIDYYDVTGALKYRRVLRLGDGVPGG